MSSITDNPLIIDIDFTEIKKVRKSKYRARYRIKQYGMTNQDYQLMLETQSFSCKACKTPFLDATPNIDHDHSCCSGGGSCGKCVRGLLCSPCNKSLGLLQDSIFALKGLISYLETTSTTREVPSC